MAAGEPTGKLGRFADLVDHPLVLIIGLTFVVAAMSAVFSAGFSAIGWSGPASLFHHS